MAERPTKADDVPWPRRINWWLLLAGPTAMAIATAGYHYGWDRLDATLEVVGPFLAAIPAVLYLVRAIVTRNPLYVILVFVAGSLLCREIHFTGMDKAIFVLGGITIAWAIAWRKRLAAPLTDWRHTTWLIAAMAAYFFSQLIAKRVFSVEHIPIVPGEAEIHSKLEELAETVGHLLFIMASLVGSWRRHGGDGGPGAAAENPDATGETGG